MLAAGRHAVGERFLIVFEGTGAAQLGDLKLTLAEDKVTLERTADREGLATVAL